MALVRKFLRALRKLFKVRPKRKSRRRVSRRRKMSARRSHRPRKIFRKARPRVVKKSQAVVLVKVKAPPAMKKIPKSTTVKVAKKVSPVPVGKPVPKRVAEPPGILVGDITHYFSRIGVCVVKVTAPSLIVGDNIRVKGTITNFVQKVASLQIESVNVRLAKKGDLVGLKVTKICRVGDQVFKISS